MIKSSSIAKGVSSLVIKDQGWTWQVNCDSPGEVVSDHAIHIGECGSLIERLASRLAMPHDACRTEVKPARMEVIDLDQAYPLVGILLADLRPRQGLRDRRRELLGGAHR